MDAPAAACPEGRAAEPAAPPLAEPAEPLVELCPDVALPGADAAGDPALLSIWALVSLNAPAVLPAVDAPVDDAVSLATQPVSVTVFCPA